MSAAGGQQHMNVNISLNLGDCDVVRAHADARSQAPADSESEADTRILELKDRVKELEEALRLEVRAHADARSHFEEALRLEACAHADALRTRPRLSDLQLYVSKTESGGRFHFSPTCGPLKKGSRGPLTVCGNCGC